MNNTSTLFLFVSASIIIAVSAWSFSMTRLGVWGLLIKEVKDVRVAVAMVSIFIAMIALITGSIAYETLKVLVKETHI